MTHAIRRCSFVIALAAVSASLTAQSAPDPSFASDAARLSKATGLIAGQTVADIGAGGGELTLALARIVGPTGRVYSTEINADRVVAVRKAATTAGLTNVTALEGHATKTNLPDQCCDALVIRFVYHHFADPKAMNESLFKSLKPGGHVAVIDFGPKDKEGASPANRGDSETHGVKPPTVISELTAAGFELVTQEEEAAKEGRGFMVVMRRPR